MKKDIIFKIFAVIMIILSIRGIFFVVIGEDFSFTNLPMYAIYLILCAVILVTGFVVWLAFIKQSKKMTI